MSQLPAMPVWWGDFFNKTDHLSNAEQWAYAKLLAKTWIRNCRPFPDSAPDLARVLGLTVKKWLAMRPRIAPFFDLSEGTWRQLRLEEEFAFVAERAENSRRNGKQGGRPKKNDNKDMENPAGSSQQTPEEPTHTHTQKEGSVGSNEPTAAKPAVADFSIVAGMDYAGEDEVRAAVFRIGKEICGPKAGGLIKRLIDAHAGNIRETLDTIIASKRKDDSRTYLAKIAQGEQQPETDWDAVYRRMGMQ